MDLKYLMYNTRFFIWTDALYSVCGQGDTGKIQTWPQRHVQDTWGIYPVSGQPGHTLCSFKLSLHTYAGMWKHADKTFNISTSRPSPAEHDIVTPQSRRDTAIGSYLKLVNQNSAMPCWMPSSPLPMIEWLIDVQKMHEGAQKAQAQHAASRIRARLGAASP